MGEERSAGPAGGDSISPRPPARVGGGALGEDSGCRIDGFDAKKDVLDFSSPV